MSIMRLLGAARISALDFQSNSANEVECRGYCEERRNRYRRDTLDSNFSANARANSAIALSIIFPKCSHFFLPPASICGDRVSFSFPFAITHRVCIIRLVSVNRFARIRTYRAIFYLDAAEMSFARIRRTLFKLRSWTRLHGWRVRKCSRHPVSLPGPPLSCDAFYPSIKKKKRENNEK